jgi:hypothetical protein
MSVRSGRGLVNLCTKRFRGNVGPVAGVLTFGGVRPGETAARRHLRLARLVIADIGS